MGQIADLLLAAGALGAGFYCFILSRRLRRFNDLEKGVGGAVALLSAQVDDLTRALSGAQDSATNSQRTLTEQVHKAEATAQRLELLVASVHDVGAPSQSRDTLARNGTAVAAVGAPDADGATETVHFARRSLEESPSR